MKPQQVNINEREKSQDLVDRLDLRDNQEMPPEVPPEVHIMDTYSLSLGVKSHFKTFEAEN